MNKKVVLITGTSSGVGLEFLKIYSSEKYFVVATVLEHSLELLKKERIQENDSLWIRTLDVQNVDRQQEIVKEINEKLGGVDILINNAGVSYRTVVEDMTPEDEMMQMSVNYLGPLNLIRLVLPGMREKRAGHIINISSVSGMMAMPTMASYSASKWALEGATEALWYEMKPWGVKVSCVQPGFINSLSFQKVFQSKKLKNDEGYPGYSPYYKFMSKFVSNFMQHAPYNARDVAKVILKTMETKKPRMRIPATPDAWAFYFFRRWVPSKVYHWLLYKNLPGIKYWGKEDGIK